MYIYTIKQTNKQTNTNMKNTKEISKRFSQLVNDPDFIKLCIECSKKVGLSAGQWNTNKAAIMTIYALKAIELEIQQN